MSLVNKVILFSFSSFSPNSILNGTPLSSQILNFSPGVLSELSISDLIPFEIKFLCIFSAALIIFDLFSFL